MPDINDQVERFRAELRAGADRETAQLARLYAEAIRQVSGDLNRLLAVIDAAKAQGLVPTRGSLAREVQLRRLLTTYRTNLTTIAAQAVGSADRLVADAARAAVQDAAQLAGGATAPITDVATHTAAVTNTGPLADLLAQRAGADVDRASEVIRDGILRGRSPYATARELRRITQGNFANSVMVARTEQLRAYTSGSLQSYRDNPAVSKWRWSSRCTDRTCAYCFAMHGQEFDVSEEMARHPNCMCVAVPVVPHIDYGRTGPDRFDDLPDTAQQRVLGPTAHKAYTDGLITLPDLVAVTNHPEWGPTGRTRALRELLTPDQIARLRAK